MLFGEYRSDEADECCAVGEDTDDIGAPTDFLVEPFLYPALVGGATAVDSGFSG